MTKPIPAVTNAKTWNHYKLKKHLLESTWHAHVSDFPIWRFKHCKTLSWSSGVVALQSFGRGQPRAGNKCKWTIPTIPTRVVKINLRNFTILHASNKRSVALLTKLVSNLANTNCWGVKNCIKKDGHGTYYKTKIIILPAIVHPSSRHWWQHCSWWF